MLPPKCMNHIKSIFRDIPRIPDNMKLWKDDREGFIKREIISTTLQQARQNTRVSALFKLSTFSGAKLDVVNLSLIIKI